MKKSTLIALVGLVGVSALGTYAVAQNAPFQGQGFANYDQTQFADASSGKRGHGFGRHGQGRGEGPRFCNAEFEGRMEERQEAIDAFVYSYLGLNANQQALYAAVEQTKESIEDQQAAICEQIGQGQRPDRQTMQSLHQPVKEAMDAFVASLSDDQKQAFSLVAPKPLGGPNGGHGGPGGMGGHRGSFNN